MNNFYIQQIDKDKHTAVLVGCILFEELNQPDIVRATFRNNDEYYQRSVNPTRLKDISKYIEKTILSKDDMLPLFPTSIILALDNTDLDFETANLGDEFKLGTLPRNILIVDGQHRFFAMKKLYEEADRRKSIYVDDCNKILEYLNSYRFNCCILLNYDLWEQAQIFATVNFNQRKVNKSLFYDIYGIEAPGEEGGSIPKQNEIYVAHLLVKFLNSDEKSPLCGFIKMLGTGKGFISQAFLVEQIMKHFSATGIWIDVVEDLKQNTNKKLYKYAASELVTYLSAVKFAFKTYWPEDINSQGSVLCKTTGVGAIMVFLRDLHDAMPVELVEDLKNNPESPELIEKLIYYFFENLSYLKDDAESLFSTGDKGNFKSTGGTGLQRELYKEMKSIWLRQKVNNIQ